MNLYDPETLVTVIAGLLGAAFLAGLLLALATPGDDSDEGGAE